MGGQAQQSQSQPNYGGFPSLAQNTAAYTNWNRAGSPGAMQQQGLGFGVPQPNITNLIGNAGQMRSNINSALTGQGGDITSLIRGVGQNQAQQQQAMGGMQGQGVGQTGSWMSMGGAGAQQRQNK